MMLCMVVLGGMVNVGGVVLASAAQPRALVAALSRAAAGALLAKSLRPSDLRMLHYGLALVLMMLSGAGILPSSTRRRELDVAHDEGPWSRPVAEVLLAAHGIVKRNGGFCPRSRRGPCRRRGEIFVLIGPNGAARLTLVNVLKHQQADGGRRVVRRHDNAGASERIKKGSASRARSRNTSLRQQTALRNRDGGRPRARARLIGPCYARRTTGG